MRYSVVIPLARLGSTVALAQPSIQLGPGGVQIDPGGRPGPREERIVREEGAAASRSFDGRMRMVDGPPVASASVTKMMRNKEARSTLMRKGRSHACSAEPALQAHVPSAAIDRRTPMMKYAIAAAGLVAFTAPGLATSGSSTTDAL